MADPVGGAGSSGGVSSVGSLGPITSINFIFAKLQMELAATSKEAARDHITQVEKANEDQKKVADMLQQCRKLQEQAKSGDKCTKMPDDIRKFMDEHGLAYSLETKGVDEPTTETADSWHNKDEWDGAIQSLQAHQETLGTAVQTEMVYVQDFMGQYNSFTQGANSAIQSAMQTLTNVARGQ